MATTDGYPRSDRNRVIFPAAGGSPPASRFSERRSFLKVGGLTLGGLSLQNLLAARAAAGEARKDTAVILFFMAGGPSHIDTYDMKPLASPEVRGPFKPINTKLPGLQICELMPRQAAIADRLSVIRSLAHTYAVHDDGQHLVQTGMAQLNARQAGQRFPCQGAVTSYVRGATRPGMPPYVCVPEDYRSHQGFYQSASFLSARHNAINSGGDPTLGNYRAPDFDCPPGVDLTRMQDRRKLFTALDGLRRQCEANRSLEDLDEVQQQAFELSLGRGAREAFDVSREPEKLKDKYGRHAWGQYALLSRRLVEAGATFVTINLYEKDVDWWDDHTNIEKNLRARLPVYDQALAALIEDLADRGLSERVLVVACGEFGRSPVIGAGGGRDHWPRAMHAVLSGGGIKAGQIIGSTDANGGSPKDRPLTPGDLLASIYKVLGIDSSSQMIPDRQNRPVSILPTDGIPIRELFG